MQIKAFVICTVILFSSSNLFAGISCDPYQGTEKLNCLGTNNRLDKNYSKALEYYKKGCALNSADSCYLADDLLRKNLNDPKQAKKFREKACSLKFEHICNMKLD
jgi:hypothetical protein